MPAAGSPPYQDYGRTLPQASGSRPSTRRGSARKLATLVLVVGLAVLLVLSLIPLRSVGVVASRATSYAVEVPADGFGAQSVNRNFLSLCNSNLGAAGGNFTYWVAWHVLGAAQPSYVRLQEIPFATLYNESGLRSGGFAQSNASALEMFCSGNLFLGAYSTVALNLSVQVGVVYDHPVKIPIL